MLLRALMPLLRHSRAAQSDDPRTQGATPLGPRLSLRSAGDDAAGDGRLGASAASWSPSL